MMKKSTQCANCVTIITLRQHSECPYFLGLRSEIFQEFIMDPPFLHPISKILQFLHRSDIEGLQWEEMVQNTSNTT